jgi:mycothiol synthase
VRRIDVVRRPSTEQRLQLTDFVERIATHTGTRPLSDHLWLDLRAGGAPGFVAASVRDAENLIALAQISTANDGGALELVVDDESPSIVSGDDRRRIADDAVATVAGAFVADGGGSLTWWVDGDGTDVADLAGRLGLNPLRRLHEMRRTLPRPDRAEIVTRDFDPDLDAEAWLRVNNRAFASHAEQGGWTSETLALRLAEDWFDPHGFRIHEIDGEMAGFCWTKLHTETQPTIGEIYVIAVDPAHHGRGLGRQLTLAGLDSISDRGITVANLYVDAGNTTAVHLYERLGFSVHRTRTAFAGTLGGRPAEPAAGEGEPR